MGTDKPWLNGKPYYCKCGLGGGEVMACEDGGCEMESAEDAQRRAALSRNAANENARASVDSKNTTSHNQS